MRSHGPKIKGLVNEQTHTVGGGSEGDDVGGDIPDALGECSDVQLYIFETVPAWAELTGFDNVPGGDSRGLTNDETVGGRP